MKLCIASDHRGYKLKEQLIEYLNNKYDIEDLGTNSIESVDYTKYAFLLGEKIKRKECDFGIAICGTGIGISIACNKVKGVRCAKVDSVEDAKLTRNDNDSNIIAFSGAIELSKAIEYVETFLNTPFSKEEKHIRRVNDIINYERGI